MGKRQTSILTPYDHTLDAAAGIHDPDKAETYMFRSFVLPNGRPKPTISIGRGPSCDISVRDEYASARHLVLERQPEGHMIVQDMDSTNGVYVDGKPAYRPFVLKVGMHLKIGYARLYAVDREGRYPITATTVDDFMRHAARIYGTNTVAGEKVKRSRETVRRRVVEPRKKPAKSGNRKMGSKN